MLPNPEPPEVAEPQASSSLAQLTTFPDLGTSSLPIQLNRPGMYNTAPSSTSRLPTKHVRSKTEGQSSRSFGRLSKLLGAVLASPFTDSPSTTDSRSRSVDSQTPRSPSPSPSMDYTIVSVPSTLNTPRIRSLPLDVYSSRSSLLEGVPTTSSRLMFSHSPSKKTIGLNGGMTSASTPGRSGNKRMLPRIWTMLSSPSKDTRIRFKRKDNSRRVCSSFGDYPLDGEEGELVDDEACFVDIPKGIDIVSLLPPEIAVYLLLFLDLPSILLCLSVSQNWRRLASDPLVWRSLFHANPGWEINNELAQRRLAAVTPIFRGTRTNSVMSVANSFRNELDTTLGRVRRLQTPPPTPVHPHNQSHLPRAASPSGTTSGTHHRQSICSTTTTVEMALSSPNPMGSSIPEGALAPLTLDWQALYKTRLEIERRICGMPPTKRTSTDAELSVGTEPHMMKLSGHSDSVYCLEFDAYKIVTGSRDKTIKVWSLRTGKLKSTLLGHTGSVLCLKFDASGFMVSGSSDQRILVWDLESKEVRKVLTGHQNGVLDIRMDKEWIVSSSKDAVIRVWNRATLKPHCSLRGHDGPVNAVGLQGGKIVSASGDGRMILWDIATASKIRTFSGNDRGLACIEFKDDYICSGSNDWKIKVWSASTGACLTTLNGHNALVRALSFNPRTGRLVSGSYDKTVKMWDIHSGTMIREFQNIHESHIFDVKFDASHVVSTSHDQKIVVLDWSYGLDATLLA